VFPGPLYPGLDPTFYTISIVAAVLIMIPIGLALFFWSLEPPKSDLKKRLDSFFTKNNFKSPKEN